MALPNRSRAALICLVICCATLTATNASTKQVVGKAGSGSLQGILRTKKIHIKRHVTNRSHGGHNTKVTKYSLHKSPPPPPSDAEPCSKGGLSCDSYEDASDAVFKACNAWLCNEERRKCEPVPKTEGAVCNDETYDDDPCNEGPGRCMTVDGDDGSLGVCLGVPKSGVTCDDYNECTVNDVCKVEEMEDGSKIGTCEGEVKKGMACDDEEACTYDDKCVLKSDEFGDFAECRGTKKKEGSKCEPFEGCASEAVCAVHSEFDEFTCVAPKKCSKGSGKDSKNGDKGGSGKDDFVEHCEGDDSIGKRCDDDDPCSADDTCMVDRGFIFCKGTRSKGMACDDDNQCTDDDKCVEGDGKQGLACKGKFKKGKECDDGNDDTSDDVCVSDVTDDGYNVYECKGE